MICIPDCTQPCCHNLQWQKEINREKVMFFITLQHCMFLYFDSFNDKSSVSMFFFFLFSALFKGFICSLIYLLPTSFHTIPH